jgi:hypothetical protein
MWQRELVSPHLWYFTPGDLRRLGEKCGLRARKTMELSPITLRGISHRVFAVEGQSMLTGILGLVGALVLTPALHLFPRDIGVVLLRKA